MGSIDEQRLSVLIGRYGAALVLYARQWCSDPEDAAQEAFFELSKLVVSPEDQIAWLFTTTRRRAINQTRGNQRRRVRNSIAESLAGQRKNNDSKNAWFTSELEGREEIEKLQRELEKLEPLEREVVVSHIWGELTFAQISKLVDRPTSSVHRCYQAALIKLRQAWHPSTPQTLNSNKEKPPDKFKQAREPDLVESENLQHQNELPVTPTRSLE